MDKYFNKLPVHPCHEWQGFPADSIKKITSIIFLAMLIGCQAQTYTTDDSINVYVNTTYGATLHNARIKIIKCYPGKNDEMHAVFTDRTIDNNFPATIRIQPNNKEYKVFFDKEYLKNNKEYLLSNINTCMGEVERLNNAKITWK